MNQDLVGKSVSLDCGTLGFYQGFIKSIQLDQQTLTLEKAFQNGKPCNVPNVTLSAVDIRDLKFVETKSPAAAAASRAASSSSAAAGAKASAKSAGVGAGAAAAAAAGASTVQVARKKPKNVAENLMSGTAPTQQQQQKATSRAGKGGAGGGGAAGTGKANQAARFSPALAAALPGVQGKANQRGSPRKGMQQQQDQYCGGGGGGTGRFTPGGNSAGGNNQQQGLMSRRQRDEDCFGAASLANDADVLAVDFDFDGNLALFDKKQVFQEIEGGMAAATLGGNSNGGSNQPDVVRLVDCNLRKTQQAPASSSSPASEAKYRNDENVLVTIPAQYRLIETGEVPPPGEYVTDSGLLIPAVSPELRERIDKTMEAKGIHAERVTELMARSTVELALQLFGGAHRLNPDNSHQVPLAVALCGPNRPGGFGMAAARHLAAQGIRTVAYLPDLPHLTEDLRREFDLYKLTGAKWTDRASDLPSSPVDLVVCAMEDHEMWRQERRQPWLAQAQKWALESRAPVLSLDPPSRPGEPVLPSKVSLLPSLPEWFNNTYGKLYVANLGIPGKVYKHAGVARYQPPFGPKTVLPIHRVT